MIKTIVVPTDGSDHPNRAVDMAGEIGAKFGARVVVLQALLHHTGTTELKKMCGKIGDRIAEKARQRLEEKGVEQITPQVIDGKPAENIIAAAEHENADLIVMGRRGLGEIAGLLMGTVSHRVTHLAECACLTVK